MKASYVGLMLFVTITAALGCATKDSRTKTTASATQLQSLKQAVGDLDTMSLVKNSANDAATATSTLNGMFDSYRSFTSEVLAADAQDNAGLLQQAETATCFYGGTIEWTETKVTWNDCSDQAGVMAGTIVWTGDTFTVDLTYTYGADQTDGGDYTGSYSYEGELTITDKLISGSLSFDYEVDVVGTGYSYTITMDVSYNDVAVTDGCPSGGSLDMTGDWSYDLGGDSYDYPLDVTVDFAGCDNATVYY
jgi:hypothetical protein